MKKNFAKLASVGIACLCIFSVMGQGVIIKEKVNSEKDLELRSDNEIDYCWPDSFIMYNSSGIPMDKACYDKDNQTVHYSSYVNGRWSDGSTYSSDGYCLIPDKVGLWAQPASELIDLYIPVPYPLGCTFFQTRDQLYTSEYDDNGNLTSIGAVDFGSYQEIHINYNENNNPVLIAQDVELTEYTKTQRNAQYEYNENGHITIVEISRFHVNSILMYSSVENVSNFPQGILIIRGNSGWSKKLKI